MRRATGRAIAAAFAVLLGLGVVAPVAAADPVFGTPSAESTFGQGISFRQPVDSPVILDRVEILLEYPTSLGPYVVEVLDGMPSGYRDLEYRLTVSDGGHLVPNTTIAARWRLVPADRSRPPIEGPTTTVVYRDDRFEWRTVSGDLVRLHWHEGSAAFGRRALEIGERAVREAAAFLGVTERDPVDFFVYADEEAFRDVGGPATRENVGGQYHPAIRTMFARIGSGDVDDPWVQVVIPHELAHLVFDTAVRNPYHAPPRWLNEGVAVYLSEGYTASDRAAVEAAAGDGRLMPLRALGGLFPTSAEQFFLAYAESVSAVAFLGREYGEDALVRLVRSYADGVTDDEAFEAAVGLDLAGFEAAWLADLGAATPIAHGPREAAPGPLPGDWTDGGAPAPTDAPASPSPPSGQPSATPGSAPGGGGGGSGPEPLVYLALVAVAGLLVGGALGYARRRRGASEPSEGRPSDDPGWPA